MQHTMTKESVKKRTKQEKVKGKGDPKIKICKN
jgi:hypothetical protein